MSKSDLRARPHLPHPRELLDPLAVRPLLVVVGLLVGLGGGLGIAGLVGLLVGLGGGVGVAGLVGLLVGLARLVRLAEEGLVGVVGLGGSCVGAELGLLLLLFPLAHGNRDASTDSGRWDCSHQQPRPGGSGAAVFLCRSAL